MLITIIESLQMQAFLLFNAHSEGYLSIVARTNNKVKNGQMC